MSHLAGIVARGTNSPESDVDIAIFLNSKMEKEVEDKLSDIVVDMNLKYDRVFSVIDIDNAMYQKWRNVTPFYQNVDREGVVLWEEDKSAGIYYQGNQAKACRPLEKRRQRS